jgi:hypothetical protein
LIDSYLRSADRSKSTRGLCSATTAGAGIAGGDRSKRTQRDGTGNTDTHTEAASGVPGLQNRSLVVKVNRFLRF